MCYVFVSHTYEGEIDENTMINDSDQEQGRF